MERERFTLALIVCLILTIFYINLIAPPPQNNNPNNGNLQNKDQTKQDPNPTKDDPNQKKPDDSNQKKPDDSGWKPPAEVKTAVLENEMLKVELSSKGASIQNVWLKQYFYANIDKTDPNWKTQQKNWLQLLAPDEVSQNQGSFGIKMDSLKFDTSLENWNFKQLTPESVEFTFDSPDAPLLTKKYTLKKSPDYTLPPEKQATSLYQIGFEIQIDKKNAKENKFQFTLNTARKLNKERNTSSYGAYPTYHAAYGTADTAGGTQAAHLSSTDLKSFGPEGKVIDRASLENQYQSLHWAGIMDKFFACLIEIPLVDRTFIGQVHLRPKESHALLEVKMKDAIDPQKKLEFQTKLDENLLLDIDSVNFDLPQPRTLQWTIHCGPKDILESANLKHAIDFGYFETFARWMIWILNTFQHLTGSYGFAIIFLTILVKMLMFPLTRKQQVTMQDYTEKMNKIRPKMEKIKEKYANDRIKMNEATMELFREHNVQIFPFMGCIPMFIQLPIFFGIFSALQVYPPLRQAQWLWVNDLTAQDSLFTFGTSFWLIGNSFNLLPILMTLTWIKQTSMMPKSDDPQMQLNQKMMKFMPIFIGFMMYSAPSGLTLYWFCSTLLGIFEQLYIKKFVKKSDVLSTPEKTAGNTAPSSFVSGIEAMFKDPEKNSPFKKMEDKKKDDKNENSKDGDHDPKKRKHKKKK